MSALQTAADPELRRIDEAMQWLDVLREGAMDENVLAAWLKWSGDAQNLLELERLQQIWEGVGRLDREQLLAPPARPASRWTRPRLAWAAGVALAICASAAWYWSERSSGRNYVTAVAVTSDIPLSDGSRVELAPSSSIVARFSPEKRIVNVESGEAYFSVAKDPARPFIVDIGDLRVVALGTAFNIHKAHGRVRVSVTEGVVSVSSVKTEASELWDSHSSAPVRASAGEQVEYSIADRRLFVNGADVRIATAWRSGMLKFINEPLGDVVADLNRYSDRELIIEDDELTRLPYTGTVFAGRIDQWLLAVQDAFPLHVQADGEHRVRLQKK